MAMNEDEAKELQVMVRELLTRFSVGTTARGRRKATWGITRMKVDEADRLDSTESRSVH